ncbi:MAG: PAS domain-containing protein [Candidatus Promineifilaceae bacterium]|jgi:PAS domain S-box-containing protein
MPENSRIHRTLRALDPRHSLRAQVALTFGGLAILLAIFVSFLLERTANANMQAASGNELAELAFYLADALDHDLYTGYQDLQLLSLTEPLIDPELPLAAKQDSLARFHEIFPHFIWVGLADISGQILAGSGERPDDAETVTNMPWFEEALQGPSVGDLYVELTAEDLAHYVTISVPVLDKSGQPIGVLGAYLNEGWVDKIETSLLQTSRAWADVNILILTKNGHFLFGKNVTRAEIPCTEIVSAAQNGKTGYQVYESPDGTTYLTGYAPIQSHPDLSSPDWLVATCQEVAMIPSFSNFQQRVLIIGSALSILFLIIGWGMAGRITNPLKRIATAANRLRHGERGVSIPVYTGKNEVGVLSRSLHELVTGLAERTNELVAADKGLQQVNATLETIIQSVPLAIFLLDPDGSAYDWNITAGRMFDCRKIDQTSPRNAIDALLEESDFRQMLHRVLVGGEILTNVETRHIQPDGTSMVLNIAMAPTHDPQGQPTGAVMVLADVTERKQSEEQLREAHRTLAILMSNLPGMAFRRHLDHPYSLMFVSDGCFNLTGYTREALLDNDKVKYVDLIHPDDREMVFMKIAQGIEERQPYQCIYRIITASNRERWVWEKGDAIFADDGTLQALEGFITDNTNQVMNQLELEELVADHTQKLSVLNDVLRLTNTTGDLTTLLYLTLQRMLSATHCEIGYLHLRDEHGYIRLATQEGLPPSLLEFVARIPIEQASMACSWVVAKNAVLSIPEISTDSRTSHLTPLSPQMNAYMGVPLAAGENVVGVLSLVGQSAAQFGIQEIDLMLDVGRQIGRSIEMAQLRREKSHLMVMKERNRLARDLHDSVTQSLYSLVLFAEAGRRNLEKGQIEQATKQLSRVTDTGQQALKEMRLFIHKIRPIALQEEGLQQALQQRLKAVEGRSGIEHELIVEGKLDLPPRLEEALYHISQEALNNSLKHARASKVSMRLACDEQQIEMEITDNGRGFDVDKARYSDGVGLKSMRERIEEFDGKVTLRSAPGQGTTVLICLPLKATAIP